MSDSLRIVIIFLALSLIAGAITGNPFYYRLSYLWGLLILASWLMSFFALRGIRVIRKSRTYRSQVGQIFEERYEVYNTGRFPRLWIEVRDKSGMPGSHGSHVVTMIRGQEGHSYLSRTRLMKRGVFTLGPTVIASGDLFGMFQTEKSITTENKLLVYPIMVNVQSFPNPPGLLPGGEALRRKTLTITSNAAGVREYEPGDPLNRIHWLSTARRNKLIVKEFELDPLADVWIFLDAEQSVHVEEEVPDQFAEPQELWRKRFVFQLPPSTMEYAVTVSASLARYYLEKRRAVGLAYSSASLRIIPADRGGRQLGKILESLALADSAGKMPLESLVELQARHLPRGSTSILVTPNASEKIFHTADLMIRRGLRPIVVLINTDTFGDSYSSSTLADTLKAIGVPVRVISKGDDIGAALSNSQKPIFSYS
ncbi:MAG: DUF58 domain-containing protein [Anaerolineales bacterium]